MKNINRRKFIHQTSCAAVGTSTLFSTLLNMKAANAAAMSHSTVQDHNEYKALVCVLLQGGNDSFNMLLPKNGKPYQDYVRTRTNNALRSEDIIPITRKVSDGREMGLHPSMTNIKRMYDEGKVAFLSNIGTLVEPTSTDDFFLERTNLPLGLLSHSDQIQHWQTAFPQDRTALGWGGKMSELIKDMNNNTSISMNISMDGSNVFQTGRNATSYSMNPVEGPNNIIGYGENEFFSRIRTKAIDDIIEHNYQDIFEQTYADIVKNARDSSEQFVRALNRIQSDGIVYPSDQWNIGSAFNMVKNTISARDSLDQQRQTFFINYEGWDHHDELINAQASRLEVLDQSINSFQKSLALLGMEDQVTTFIISDFARGLISNGNGTDHAWGGNVFVIGGAVQGGDIYGEYPDISLGDSQDIGGGIFLPKISADEYFAELAMWFGVNPSDLPSILPNIGNFYDVRSGQSPLGFLNL